MKHNRAKLFPHVVRLPRTSISPSKGIYHRYDIVEQSKVLNTYSDSPNVVRSAAPFRLRVAVGTKIKELNSKLEEKLS